jgi:hypothetical protein
MRVPKMGMLVLVLPLAGCQTDGLLIPDPFARSKAELAAKDDETCRSYGAKPGTDIYIQCRMTQQQRRDAADGGGVMVVNAPPATSSDAPVLRNIIPPTVRCQTIGTQTVCR